MRPPRGSWPALVALAALSLGAATGATLAAFSARTVSASNAFSAAADLVAPQIDALVIGKAAGGLTGAIKAGGSYHVYAQVNDPAPSSGIAAVSADVSAITAGATAAALAAGSYQAGGLSYNYRSTTLTASSALAAGTAGFSVTAADAAGNQATAGGSVIVDNTPPDALDVQTANGGTAGTPDENDTITFTFSEPVEPATVLSGWDGTTTNVVVQIADGLLGNDTLTVLGPAGIGNVNLGSVNLARADYVTLTTTYGLVGNASRMVLSANSVTVTLGTPSGLGGLALGAGTMSWSPSTAVTDAAGNACSAASATESGSADRDF